MAMFILLCLCFLTCGVFGDEVKSVSVMEGDNVTLHTDTEKQTDDRMMWYYGPENTFVARINGKANSKKSSDDERFRDRLMLDDQTGDLTITNITTENTGVYTLKISRNNEVTYKKFNVTLNAPSKQTQHINNINDHCHMCPGTTDSPVQRVIIIPVVVTLVLCVIIILCVYKHKRALTENLKKPLHAKVPLNDEEKSMSCSSKFEDGHQKSYMHVA